MYTYIYIYIHIHIYNTYISIYRERDICRYMYTLDYAGNNKNIRFQVTK